MKVFVNNWVRDGEKQSVSFLCPGCKFRIDLPTTHKNGANAQWSFNGDANSPTLTPSILSRGYIGDVIDGVCHSYITDGKIQFLSDSTHELRGQTVELPDIDPEKYK